MSTSWGKVQFIVNGIVKSEVYIGVCQAILEKGCALSIPGLSPKTSIDYDAAKAACVANGPGFHLISMGLIPRRSAAGIFY